MSRSDKVLLTRIFTGIALILLVIALILEIVSFFTPVSGALSSIDAFGSFLAQKLVIAISAVIIFFLMAATYSMVFTHLNSLKSKPRDYSLIIAIICIIFSLIFLPELVLVAGVLIFLTWLVLVL